jgi:sugar lactone lactonase YvrE
MRTGAFLLGPALLALLAIGCSERSAVAPAETPGILSSAIHTLCDPPEVEPLLEFDEEGTAEGVAVAQDGDVFIGRNDQAEIWRVPKGDFDDAYLLADLPGGIPLGMDTDRTGNLYVAVVAHLDPDFHGLWKVQPDGTAERVAALPAFFVGLPNDVAIDPRGNVYVSDSFDGKIWRLTPGGEWSVWVQDDLLRAFFGEIEFGVNGLVYHRWALYAAITLNGRVIKVQIQPDGTAGTPAVFVEDPALIGIDGIEPDPQGNFYVANNFASTIQLIRARDVGIETIAGEGLSAPASLVFADSHRVLLVANLSTSAGVPQPYAPALVEVAFPTPVVACTSLH